MIKPEAAGSVSTAEPQAAQTTEKKDYKDCTTDSLLNLSSITDNSSGSKNVFETQLLLLGILIEDINTLRKEEKATQKGLCLILQHIRKIIHEELVTAGVLQKDE